MPSDTATPVSLAWSIAAALLGVVLFVYAMRRGGGA